jgi:uncharacterized protein
VGRKVTARGLVEGVGAGQVLILEQPLSLWGGVDPESGRVVERSHPQHGESLAGRVVVMPHGRGSSSASSVLAELLRKGCAPSAILLAEPDSILVIGALVARALYGADCPIAVVASDTIEPGQWCRVTVGPEETELEFFPGDADTHG